MRVNLTVLKSYHDYRRMIRSPLYSRIEKSVANKLFLNLVSYHNTKQFERLDLTMCII